MKIENRIRFALQDRPRLLKIARKINCNINLPIISLKKNFLLRKFKSPRFKHFNIKNHKFSLLLDPKNGGVDCQAFLNKVYEKKVTEILLKNLGPKSTFIDVGANIGYFTNLAASVCHEGQVFAFEPIKRIYEQNNKSVKKNNFTNVQLFNLACGSKNESSEIFMSSSNMGGSSIIKNKLGLEGVSGKTYREKISIKKLDEVLKGIKKIDLIKMDVEGFEYYAFLGMKNSLKKFKPKIVFEFSYYVYENIERGLSKKILHLLSNLGYSLLDLDLNQKIVDIKSYLKTFENSTNVSDIFCVPKKIQTKNSKIFF